MKKTFFCAAFVLGGVFFLSAPVQAATIINTHITADTTWTTAGSPYIVNNRLVVQNGATLTIEAGVVVKVKSDMSVVGQLLTHGTKEAPVIFTSIHDDVAGDTNNNGSITTPAPGQWLTLSSPMTTGRIDLQYTELRYGGGYSANLNGALTVAGGDIILDHVYFHQAQFPFIRTVGESATVTVNNSRFEDTDGEAIMTNGGIPITIRNSVFKNIAGWSIYNSYNSPLLRQVDAAYNYWGSDLGPERMTRTRPDSAMVSNNVITDPFLTSSPFCEVDCFSNVLFLPGIMGSRLYETNGTNEDELWFSSLSARHENMEMNSDGTSKNDVYTKELGGILDDTYGLNLYKSFLEDLEDWKTEGMFNNYAAVPYDWRVSLDDVVMNGKLENGQLKYTTDNTDIQQSYLYQKLKGLQASSKSGKVTLIGHSNGGLVIKALVQKLKDTNDPLYNQIDKIILVAVPQTGTPDTVVSLLYGSKLGVLWTGVSARMTRLLGHNMPTMYNLLPSEKLFNQISAPIKFTGDNVDPSWTNRYGNSISTYQEFEDFLTGQEGRNRPDFADTLSPEVLSGSLFNQAKAVHSTLDSWAPASSTQVIQIAGWGMYTVAGLLVEDDKECEFEFSQLTDGRPVCIRHKPTTTLRDKKVLGGDETVLTQSALDMPESAQVKNYWVDLRRYNIAEEIPVITYKKHKDILEVSTLRPFIKSVLQNNILDTSSDYISASEPNSLSIPYIEYKIHSPLHLTVADDQGNKAGWDADLGRVVENIKGAQYSEIGEIKTVLIPNGTPHTVKLEAYEQGSFTLGITELSGEQVVSETKFEAIPALLGTVATVAPAAEAQPVAMALDFNNDGTTETELQVELGSEIEYQNPVEQDVIAPEISVTFDQIAKDVKWSAIDDQDPSLIVEVTPVKVTATDNAGNKTEVPFTKYREGNTRLKVQFEKVITNGEESAVDKTTLIYDWQLRKDMLTDLDTDLRVKDKSRLRAEYRKFKNETRIIEKDKQEKARKVTTRPGFVSLLVGTNNKNIIWEY